MLFRSDLVSVPLLHDTPGEMAVPGGVVRDWRAGEVDLIPGSTAPSFAVVERDYTAIEVHTPGVGSLLKLIDEHHLTNVKVIQHDAVEVLEHMIPDGSLSGVHVFFPDPWPKKRHHKRRLIQPPLVYLLARKLGPSGYLHLATDWEE